VNLVRPLLVLSLLALSPSPVAFTDDSVDVKVRQAPDKRRQDAGKGRIEVPLKKLLAERGNVPARNALPNGRVLTPKIVIQAPTKRVLAEATAPAEPEQKPRDSDRSKLRIQSAVKKLLGATEAGEKAPQPPTAETKPANPTVQPGKVKWHADFKAAREAAEKSRKPVLLFQLLGRLDQRFT